MKFWPKPGLVK